jgi:hypothetical protein
MQCDEHGSGERPPAERSDHAPSSVDRGSAEGVAPQGHLCIYGRDNPHCRHFLNGILLGLLAKIKCSICSYQFNIWYTGHCLVDINLIFGLGELSQFTGGFRALAMDLHPSMAEASNHQIKISSNQGGSCAASVQGRQPAFYSYLTLRLAAPARRRHDREPLAFRCLRSQRRTQLPKKYVFRVARF